MAQIHQLYPGLPIDALELNDSVFKTKSSNFLKQQEKEDFDSLEELLQKLPVRIDFYAKSQKGSRIIQKLIEKMNLTEIQTLILNLQPYLPDVMKDTYGNYLCQKIIQFCTPEQRCFILKSVLITLIFFRLLMILLILRVMPQELILSKQ